MGFASLSIENCKGSRLATGTESEWIHSHDRGDARSQLENLIRFEFNLTKTPQVFDFKAFQVSPRKQERKD